MPSDLAQELVAAEREEAVLAAYAQKKEQAGSKGYAEGDSPWDIALTQRLDIKAGSFVRYLLFATVFTVCALSTRDHRFAYWYKRARRKRDSNASQRPTPAALARTLPLPGRATAAPRAPGRPPQGDAAGIGVCDTRHARREDLRDHPDGRRRVALSQRPFPHDPLQGG